MGSYLSILNNTEDVWSVKLGPDQAAVNIATIVGKVVAKVVAAAAKCGAPAPQLKLAASNEVVSVLGVSTATASAAALSVGVAAPAGSLDGLGARLMDADAQKHVTAPADTLAGIATQIAVEVQEQIEHELGMDRLAPGQKKRHGKMTLSLWQQCMCVRSRVNPNNNREILVEVLYMRPIFSGATNNSDLTHDIHYWLNKNGVHLLDRKILLE